MSNYGKVVSRLSEDLPPKGRRVRVYTCMQCGLTQKKRVIWVEDISTLQCVGCFVWVRANEVVGRLEEEKKVMA